MIIIVILEIMSGSLVLGLKDNLVSIIKPIPYVPCINSTLFLIHQCIYVICYSFLISIFHQSNNRTVCVSIHLFRCPLSVYCSIHSLIILQPILSIHPSINLCKFFLLFIYLSIIYIY